MPAFKEIVTKAVIGKGKKTFTDNLSLQVENSPTTILGCWVINHNFRGNMSNKTVVITGSYDKNGLPEDFLYFVVTITNFIKYYNMQEMFNPFVYGKVKRRKSEYIFCSVIFKGGYKSYYYLTDDDSIEIGDLVLVPAGNDDHEVVVEVDNIEYFSKENAPRPIEKTKRIIRKYINDDFAN